MTAKKNNDGELKTFHGGFDILDALQDSKGTRREPKDKKKEEEIREVKKREAAEVSERDKLRSEYLTLDNERIWTMIR